MAIRLKQVPKRSAGALDQIAINATEWLDGDTFTGSVTATEQTTSDLTITSSQINTGELTILGETAAISTAIQSNIDGGTAGITYSVLYEVSTTAGREFKAIACHECV